MTGILAQGYRTDGSIWGRILNEVLILKMTNSKQKEITNISESDKLDKRNHGMGIKSIRRVIRKYEGVIEFSDEGDMFIVDACLYNINIDG